MISHPLTVWGPASWSGTLCHVDHSRIGLRQPIRLITLRRPPHTWATAAPPPPACVLALLRDQLFKSEMLLLPVAVPSCFSEPLLVLQALCQVSIPDFNTLRGHAFQSETRRGWRQLTTNTGALMQQNLIFSMKTSIQWQRFYCDAARGNWNQAS